MGGLEMLVRCADDQAETDQRTVVCAVRTPFPQPPSNSPKRSQPPQVTTGCAWVQKGNWAATTQQRHGLFWRPFTHRLRVFKSVQVQVIVHGEVRFQVLGVKQKQWGSTSSREDGGWGQRSDKDQQMSPPPHEGRAQSKQQQIKKSKVEQCVFLMLNWMLLPRSRESAGSHYESAWSSPEAERTWHFICLPSSDHTSQSDSPALDDDRSEMQPADWPTEAPLHSTEQGRGSGEGVAGSSAAPEERKPTNGVCVGVCSDFHLR